MLICGFGCAALGELVPQIVPVAKYIGAAYVLYLAYKTLIRKTGSGTADAPRPLTCGNGFLLQFLNIKILMLGIAFYSGYILPYGFHPGHIVAFALVMALAYLLYRGKSREPRVAQIRLPVPAQSVMMTAKAAMWQGWKP